MDRSFQIDFQALFDRLEEIPDDANGLLKLLDGSRTLGAVVEVAGQDGLQAMATLAGLFARGIIHPAQDPPASREGEPPIEGVPSIEGEPAAEGRQQAEVCEGPSEPERADWFAGPTATEPREPTLPPPLPGGRTALVPWPESVAARAEIPPRIVRFPARPRGARATAASGPSASEPSDAPRSGLEVATGQAPAGATAPAQPGRPSAEQCADSRRPPPGGPNGRVEESGWHRGPADGAEAAGPSTRGGRRRARGTFVAWAVLVLVTVVAALVWRYRT